MDLLTDCRDHLGDGERVVDDHNLFGVVNENNRQRAVHLFEMQSRLFMGNAIINSCSSLNEEQGRSNLNGGNLHICSNSIVSQRPVFSEPARLK